MANMEKNSRPSPLTAPTLRMPASPTSASAGAGGAPSSPVSRQFSHAPYLSTNNILATEDLNAAEYESMMARGKRRDTATPGSPTANLSGSYSNAYSGSPTRNNVSGLPSGKKNVCRHFLNGNCNRGSSCRFYHPGSMHRVVTPSHPRTPTQRPLTPLADLAQQDAHQQHTSAFAATSPVHSPSLGSSAALMNSNGGSPKYARSVLPMVHTSASAGDNSSSYVSPLGSPANLNAQRGPYGTQAGQVSTNATPPTLSSPSNGPQVMVGGSGPGGARRKVSALQAIPSLLLPDCTVRASEAGGDDGNSFGPIDASPMSAPHSPTTPGAYRMPIYRFTARTGAIASPPLRQSGSVTGSSSNTNSVRQDASEASSASAPLPHGGQGDIYQLPSPPPAHLTRNNPYAYPGSPGAVQRQPKEPMSPLKRIPGGF